MNKTKDDVNSYVLLFEVRAKVATKQEKRRRQQLQRGSVCWLVAFSKQLLSFLVCVWQTVMSEVRVVRRPTPGLGQAAVVRVISLIMHDQLIVHKVETV